MGEEEADMSMLEGERVNVNGVGDGETEEIEPLPWDRYWLSKLLLVVVKNCWS
jgi:hypothetical protein